MLITGQYFKDNQGFYNVFTNDTLYTICKGGWNCVKVGQPLYHKGILTQELFDEWKRDAVCIGTFNLED